MYLSVCVSELLVLLIVGWKGWLILSLVVGRKDWLVLCLWCIAVGVGGFEGLVRQLEFGWLSDDV